MCGWNQVQHGWNVAITVKYHNIKGTLVDNKIVDYTYGAKALSVGAASTTASFSA